MAAPKGNDYAEGCETSGRPSKYKEEYAEQVFKLCLLGATDKEIADFFEVDEATVNRWKKEHEEFCKSIKDGKVNADIKVAESLYKRATGYKKDTVKVFQYQGEPVIVDVVEEIDPDVKAATTWLNNRQSAKWRDRQEISHTVEGKVDISDIIKDPELIKALAEEYKKEQRQLKTPNNK